MHSVISISTMIAGYAHCLWVDLLFLQGGKVRDGNDVLYGFAIPVIFSEGPNNFPTEVSIGPVHFKEEEQNYKNTFTSMKTSLMSKCHQCLGYIELLTIKTLSMKGAHLKGRANSLPNMRSNTLVEEVETKKQIVTSTKQQATPS